jgi:enamine deaminase RidA (YjgF/YER057c/UK114 family)
MRVTDRRREERPMNRVVQSGILFLVGDPAKGSAMDFEGLMRAYVRHFGAATQGRLPARTTVQVAALPLPGALVEIEVVAARKTAR